MRLAWQAKRLAPANAPARVKTIPELTTVVIYNLVWWSPMVLPFVGVLFRSSTTRDDRSELLIFVTPKILQGANLDIR